MNMKIVFNTKRLQAPASASYRAAFMYNKNVTFNDYDRYEKYEHALFMTYPEDLEDLKFAKINHPHLKIAIIDPRGSEIEKYLTYVDYFIVDSIEMSDFFAKYKKPIFSLLEYPDFPLIKKNHCEKNKIIIGYHGNKVHLTAMYPKITTALEQLSKDFEVEFWAVYNVRNLGKWNVGLPKGVKVKHIQWYESVYEEVLHKVDIGIAPACMPLAKSAKYRTKVNRFFLDNDDDYLLRFKMPSNAGRVVVFQRMGVPVVADFLPSYFESIQQGYTGELAYSSAAWYRALHALSKSAEYRNYISENAQRRVSEKYDYRKQNNAFMDFLRSLDVTHKSSYKLVAKRRLFDDLAFRNLFIYDRLSKIYCRIFGLGSRD